jgi:hypothetical protein
MEHSNILVPMWDSHSTLPFDRLSFYERGRAKMNASCCRTHSLMLIGNPFDQKQGQQASSSSLNICTSIPCMASHQQRLLVIVAIEKNGGYELGGSLVGG